MIRMRVKIFEFDHDGDKGYKVKPCEIKRKTKQYNVLFGMGADIDGAKVDLRDAIHRDMAIKNVIKDHEFEDITFVEV